MSQKPEKIVDLTLLTVDELIKGTEWLDAIGNKQLTIEEQLEELIPAIACPPEYLQLFKELVSFLQNKLQLYYRRNKVRAYCFGSAVTGLCLKNCDLDIFIDFDPPGETKQLLKTIKNNLYKHFRDVFTRIIYIRAKIPILRCLHEIGFECDISVANAMALHNSQLIKFLISLNDKFYLFFMCVKFWMKRNHLSGPEKLSSYSTTMLCLFYLQQKNLLPSVQFLQTHAQCPPPVILNGWNVSFPYDKAVFTPENDLQVLNLLTDFFEFYSKFEFSFYIISPFLGRPILKPFENPSDDFREYQEHTQKYDSCCNVCIQDPFCHNFNPSRNASKTSLINIQTWFVKSTEVCKDAGNEQTKKSFLKRLFSPYELRSRKRKKGGGGFGNSIELWPGKVKMYGRDENELRDNWVRNVLIALENALTRIVMASVDKQDESFICLIRHGVLQKQLRSQVAASAELSPKLPNLVRQEAISNEIMKLPAAQRDLQDPLSLTITYSVVKQPTKLVLRIAPDRFTQYFNILMVSFQQHLDAWTEDYATQARELNPNNEATPEPSENSDVFLDE